MSHIPERKEKNCLNCGATVVGKYCHVCGQENVEPKESFWHMVTHFFYDITHFDSNFFTTVKDLLFRPGFLSKEYMNGRRKSYLHPVRMYVFTSAVFFLVFFSVFKIKDEDIKIKSDDPNFNQTAFELKEEALKNSKTANDSFLIEKIYESIGPADSLKKDHLDSSGIIEGKVNSKAVSIDFGETEKYHSVAEYDSIQKSLPRKKRDGFFLRILNRKLVSIRLEYKGKEGELFKDISEKFLHNLPYLLFVSLPLYALFLKLLYIRRKRFYYVDHGIFLVHLYIFSFLFLLIYYGIDRLDRITSGGIFGFIKAIVIIAGLFYALKAMHNFYEQRWGKTILKFILFNIFCLVTLLALFFVFGLFSAFTV